MKKENSGITLIALVLTIIILLILAGVAISMIAGNEGILTRAEIAVNKTNFASAKEQGELMVAEFAADYYEMRFANREKDSHNIKIVDYIVSKIGTGKSSSNGEFTVTVAGKTVTVEGHNGYTKVTGTLNEKGKIVWDGTISGDDEEQGDGTETITLEGAGQTFHRMAPSTLTFRSTADLADFKEVQINGETLDSSCYTKTEGSTIITLSIDYLKTLDATEHEITVVSENGAPSVEFEVIEPEVNEHNFYYNQPYSTYYSDWDDVCVFFFRDASTMDVLILNSTYSETCNYTIEDDVLYLTTSLGSFSLDIVSNTELYVKELGLTCKVGNNDIYADEDYIYFFEDDTDGLEVNVINKKKESYSAIKDNINGIPVTSIERCFLDCVNMKEMPKIPSSVVFSCESFSGCNNLGYVKIPESIKVIADGDFGSCSNLKELYIHKNVRAIYSAALGGCTSLEKIIFEGTIEQWNTIAKSSIWKDGVPATEVICSDGVVPLD